MNVFEGSPLFPSSNSLAQHGSRTPSPVSRSTSVRSELKDNGIRGVDHKLLEDLIQDNVDQKLIAQEISCLTEQYYLRAVNWRQRMVHFLHTRTVGGVLLCLVVLDVIIVLISVILELEIMQDQFNLVKTANIELRKAHHQNCSVQRLSINSTSPSHGNASDYAAHGVHEDTVYEHDSPEAIIHQLENANYVLHCMSVAVLAIFSVEMLLKLIGYGAEFFRSKLQLLDAFMVIASFTLDVFMLKAEVGGELTKTVFIILFLLWRMMRIFNALSVTMRIRNKFRLKVLRKSKKAADEKIREQAMECADKAAEIKRLQNMARRYGAEEHELQTARVLSKSSTTSQPTICSMAAKTVAFTNILGYKNSMSESCVNLRTRRPSDVSDRHMYKYASSLGISLSDQERRRRRSANLDSDGPYTRMKTLGKSMEDVKQNFLTVQSSYAAAIANKQEKEIRRKKSLSLDVSALVDETDKSNRTTEDQGHSMPELVAANHSNGGCPSVANNIHGPQAKVSSQPPSCIYSRLLARKAKESLSNPPTITVFHVDDR